jgi:hypothetical protein
MSERAELLLYTGPNCSLCEKAKQVIWPVIGHTGHSLREVDITSDIELLRTYRPQIPVLHSQDEDLCWPFDEDALIRWLRCLDD